MVENLVANEGDAALLDSLDGKLQVIRDYVRLVVEDLATGLYVWGDGGISKSYTITETLKGFPTRSKKVTNTHLTCRGLFELLRDYPNYVHVIEDAETLFRHAEAFNILQSALWGQENENKVRERKITWNTNKGRDEAFFSGGIILVSNRPLGTSPEQEALATRLTPLHLQPTDEELAAKMRQIASRGHHNRGRELSPAQCLEVADAIIARCSNLKRRLNLRILVRACDVRLLWENGGSETHWLDLLDFLIKERADVPVRKEPLAVRKAGEREFARSIAHLPTLERQAAWEKETGKSRATLYRYLETVH